MNPIGGGRRMTKPNGIFYYNYMARKERNNVDYFPHPVNHGKKMFYLRSKYKNDGYAVWFMLLEELGKADFHYLNLSDPVQIMYLSANLMVDENVLTEIIETLVQFGEFDSELWDQNKILFNEKFIENIADAYKKRNNECVTKPDLLYLLSAKGVRKLPKKTLKGDGNTQRIVKDSILKDSKGNNIDEIETEILINYSFSDFWDLYDKKVGSKSKLQKKWEKLSDDQRHAIMEHIPHYKITQPDKQYRKNPETYLNNESWNDELIFKTNGQINTDQQRSNQINRIANEIVNGDYNQ